jgi:hypothetical protein
MRSNAVLVIAFVLLISIAVDRRASPQVVTGIDIDGRDGEWISVANDRTDPQGFQIALRQRTVYVGAMPVDGFKYGDRVTVWYRSVAERRFVADKVRVVRGFALHRKEDGVR